MGVASSIRIVIQSAETISFSKIILLLTGGGWGFWNRTVCFQHQIEPDPMEEDFTASISELPRVLEQLDRWEEAGSPISSNRSPPCAAASPQVSFSLNSGTIPTRPPSKSAMAGSGRDRASGVRGGGTALGATALLRPVRLGLLTADRTVRPRGSGQGVHRHVRILWRLKRCPQVWKTDRSIPAIPGGKIA